MRHTLVDTTLFSTAGAFRPADARCNHAACTAGLFQNGAAVPYRPCGRHQLLRYERPHGHRTPLILRIVDGAFHACQFQTPELLTHVVYGLRRVHAGMVVHDLIADTGNGGEVQAYVAVLATARCNDQRLTVIGFAHFRCQTQPVDRFTLQIHDYRLRL